MLTIDVRDLRRMTFPPSPNPVYDFANPRARATYNLSEAMKNTLLRTTIGGAACVAVLFTLLLLTRLAFDLLNRSSDESVAAGVVLLIFIAAAALALVYYGTRRLLRAGDARADVRRGAANTHDIDGAASRLICDELFAAYDRGDAEAQTREAAPANIKDDR